MRIAYLCEYSTLLGGERSLLTFLAEAAQRGVEPIVVAPREGRLADAVRLAGYRHIAWPGSAKRTALEVVEPLANAKIDLIHANSLSLLDVACALREELSRPAVLHVRDIYDLSAARRARLASLDAVIAVSSATGRWLTSIGAAADRLHVIANAVRVESGTVARAVDQEWDIAFPAGERRVVCVGQICLRKGQDTFLEAARRVVTESRDTAFCIVGERYSDKEESRNYEVMLHRMSEEPPLAGRVRWLSYRDDVPRLLASFDVVVVASRQEPLSRVLLEALAAGTIPVATDVGGNREILEGAGMGLLVPVDDPEAMAQAIRSGLGNDALRERCRIAGPAHVRDRYSPGRQADAILGVYESLLGRIDAL